MGVGGVLTLGWYYSQAPVPSPVQYFEPVDSTMKVHYILSLKEKNQASMCNHVCGNTGPWEAKKKKKYLFFYSASIVEMSMNVYFHSIRLYLF